MCIMYTTLLLHPKFKNTNKIKTKMKKVLAILALTAIFAACNNSGDKKEETKDTTAAPAVDTTAAPAPADTMAAPAVDTTAKPAADTTKK